MVRRTVWLLAPVLALRVATLAQAPDAKTIIRLDPKGPTPGWGMSAGEQSKTHVYYRGTAKGTSAGVWESRSLVNDVHYKAESEFMYILEGAVTLVDKDGRQEQFKAGDAFLVPRGTEFAYKQPDKLRKFYVVFDRESPETPKPKPEGTPTFIGLESDGPKGAEWTTRGNTRMYRFYGNKDGATVGVWEATKLDDANFRHPTYAELMVFLSGAMTFTSADGHQEQLKGGDVAIVPKGIDVKMKADSVRLFFVSFDNDPPKASTAQ
jgi:uncharacterized cupin superfamily protein